MGPPDFLPLDKIPLPQDSTRAGWVSGISKPKDSFGVKRCLQFHCHMNLFNESCKSALKTLALSHEQYLIVQSGKSLAMGFLETRPKNVFWQLLANYLKHFLDKTRSLNHAKTRFGVNGDYIRRLQINQRRYFTVRKSRQGPSSRTASFNDQVFFADDSEARLNQKPSILAQKKLPANERRQIKLASKCLPLLKRSESFCRVLISRSQRNERDAGQATQTTNRGTSEDDGR